MLRYGTAYSCCLRRTAAGLGVGASGSLHCLSARSGSAADKAVQPALSTAMRGKASSLRIANRKKVEMFVGRRYHLPTRLRTAAPDIAAEWDYEKNPKHLYPEIVGIGYMQPVFWTCSACASSYKMSVEKRVVRGGGCPVCEEQAVAQAMKTDNAFLERHLSEGEGAGAQEALPLLPGEENRALRPKRSTVLNLRTKY